MLEQLLPIHPKLVHFPIALFIAALGFEVAGLFFREESFHKTAIYLWVVAVLMSLGAVQTGIWEQARLHLNHPVLAQHRLLGLWVRGLALISLPFLWLMKTFVPKYFRIIFLILLFTMAALITVTAHYGGRMVYEYGVGVQN